MVHTSWFVETFQVTSRHKQQEVLELCQGVPGVSALGTSHRHEHFVIVDCSDLFWQSAVELLIAELDPSARLVQPSSVPISASGISETALAILHARRVS